MRDKKIKERYKLSKELSYTGDGKMEITACPKCGSKNIYQGTMRDGVLTGYTTKYVCKDCGYQGMPFIFDSEKEYKKFLTGIAREKNTK